MAVTATPVFVQTPKIASLQLAAVNTLQPITTLTVGANGSKIVSVIVTSTEATSRVIRLSYTRSAKTYYLSTATVPAGAGTDGTNSTTDLLASTLIPGLPIDNDGQHYFFLQTSDTLGVTATVAPTADLFHVTVIYADF